MNLLKRWRTRRQNRERPLVRRWRHDRSLARFHNGLGLRDLRDQIDQMFNDMWRWFDREPWTALSLMPEPISPLAHWPAVDMAEDEKEVTLRVDVPGLDENDLEVHVSGRQLTIHGSRTDEWDDSRHGLRRRERVSGSFTRTITQPPYADTQNIEARYEKGTL